MPVLSNHKYSAFTLLELLIVIGILAILATAVVLAINPVHLLKQARDSRRVSELKSLNDSIKILLASVGTDVPAGNPHTEYLSLPDTNSDCSSYSLPHLPAGWSYHCVTTANLTKVDGNGWIPIDFTKLDIGSPLTHLPIDPVNNSTYYYTYTTGGSFELTALMEDTQKHEAEVNDGGPNPGVYETGTDLTLTPSNRDLGLVAYWPMDEDGGTTAYDMTSNGNNGTLENGPTWEPSSSCISGSCLSFDGTDDYVDCGNDSSLNMDAALTFEAWVNPATESTSAMIIFNKESSYQWALYSHNNQLFLKWALMTAGNWEWHYTNILAPVHQWTFVTCVYNGSAVTCYKNGGAPCIINDPQGGDITDSNSSLYIARRGLSSTNYLFDGLIDEVRIYNRALSADEIKAQYNALKH